MRKVNPESAAENQLVVKVRGCPRKPKPRPKIIERPGIGCERRIAIPGYAGRQCARKIRGGDKARKRAGCKVVGRKRRPEVHQLTLAVRRLTDSFPTQTDVHRKVRVYFDVVLGEAIQGAHMEFPGSVATQIV